MSADIVDLDDYQPDDWPTTLEVDGQARGQDRGGRVVPAQLYFGHIQDHRARR